MQRRILTLLASVVVCVPAALAANGGHQQSVDIVTRMMEPLKDYWVSLRNDGDSDWIYFITLSRARCVLSEVRYSVNSDALDQVFTPYACDLRRPYTLPNTVLPKDIAVDYDDGALETVSVQATNRAFRLGTAFAKADLNSYPHTGSHETELKIGL